MTDICLNESAHSTPPSFGKPWKSRVFKILCARKRLRTHEMQKLWLEIKTSRSLPPLAYFQDLQYLQELWIILLEDGMSHSLFVPASGWFCSQTYAPFHQAQVLLDCPNLAFCKNQRPVDAIALYLMKLKYRWIKLKIRYKFNLCYSIHISQCFKTNTSKLSSSRQPIPSSTPYLPRSPLWSPHLHRENINFSHWDLK